MKRIFLIVLLFLTSRLFAQLTSLEVQGKHPRFYLTHQVAEGEQFLSLAKLYNLSPNIIASFNLIKLNETLKDKQIIKIPLTVTNFQTYLPLASYSQFIPIHRLLSRDETVASASRETGIADTTIKDLNADAGNGFKAGSKLVIGYLKIRKERTSLVKAVLPIPPPEIEKSTKVEEIKKDSLEPNFSDFDSDKLFRYARRAAFDNKDYRTALRLCSMALEKSPDYSDIRIFAGRIYAWTDKADSARVHFDHVLKNDPENKEIYTAYIDLENWNDKYERALELSEKGLSQNPESQELSIKKVKILRALKRTEEAQKVLEKLLQRDSKNPELKALVVRNKDVSLKNKMGFTYDYTYFDQQFSDPWHMGSLDYSRQTKLGSIVGHLNYANRFRSSGLQYEIEAYPHISKHFYSYVSGAYSNASIFPKYRGGFSLYALLPASMEAELGFRYLYFSSSTFIYTAAVSKYYKSWLFMGRTYLTPGDNDISQSYNFSGRYYYGGADDYYFFIVGKGISPDDRPQAVLLNKQYQQLQSTKAAIGFRHAFNNKYVLTLDLGWINQEYQLNTRGNQISTGISYQVRF